MIRRPLALTVLAAGALAAAAVPAGAAKKPTKRQGQAITGAVRTSPVGGLGDIPLNRYNVTGIRVSTVSRSWATANVTATRRYRDTFQSAYVVLVQPAGTRTWTVVDLGTAAVGCGFAPDAVLDDLRGTGYSQQCAAASAGTLSASALSAPVAAAGGTYVLQAGITRGGQLLLWLLQPGTGGTQVVAQAASTIPEAVSNPAKATLTVTANADGSASVAVLGPKNASQPDAVDFQVTWAGAPSPALTITGSGT